VRRFFVVNLGLMLAITALGIVRSVLGPPFLNPAIMTDEIRELSQTYRVAPISEVIIYRPTSIFVTTGRFSDMLIVAWMLVFGFGGYALLRNRPGRARIFAFLAFALTAARCVLCASRASMGIFHVEPPSMSVESGFGNIVIEMGIGGLILRMIMSLAVLIASWKVVKQRKGSPSFPLAFMIFWFAFLLLLPFTFLGLQAYQHFVMNAYLWLLLGVLFWLPKLGLTAEAAERSAVARAGLLGIA